MRLETSYPDPQGPGGQKGAQWDSGASAVRFGEHFIKQKFLGTPNLMGVGHLMELQIHICKDLGPVCFWSHGASFPKRVYKIKVVMHVPNRYILYHRDRELAWRGL